MTLARGVAAAAAALARRRAFAAVVRRCRSSNPEEDATVAVDRRGLGRLGYGELTEEAQRLKEVETPLGRELAAQIKARGPMSVHDFMRQCLLHPVYGYYSRAGAERS